MTSGRLLVTIGDRLSEMVAKGEITARYYNPGDLFAEIHILMSNDDRVDLDAVRATAGRATLHLHNLPTRRDVFFRSLGWRPKLLRRWAAPAVALAREVRPDLIRCHDNRLNAYAATCIKRALGIPYILSMHRNPDVESLRGRYARTWGEKLRGYAIEAVEIAALREADYVLAVYQPIVPYLRKHGIENYEVVYNAVGDDYRPKASYAIDKRRVRLISVGLQDRRVKDPTPIVEAVLDMPNVSLLLIGDGELHDALVARVAAGGAGDRIRLVRSLPNSMVLEEMSRADIYVFATGARELSKTCIEAALTGLPVVVNDQRGSPAPELLEGHFIVVDGTREGYRTALARLIDDDAYRERVGRLAAAHAREHWAPARMEARVVEIYRQVLARAGTAAEAGAGRAG
jgi:glycosyltransferase involved in cell wall biosynthesis